MDRIAFLGLQPKPTAVTLPTGVAYLRSITALERAEWIAKVDESSKDPAGAVLLSKCVCDENGARLFGDTPEDLAQINTLSAVLTDTLVEAALKLNQLSGEAANESSKNSDPGQS